MNDRDQFMRDMKNISDKIESAYLKLYGRLPGYCDPNRYPPAPFPNGSEWDREYLVETNTFRLTSSPLR